jgi:hypothetical protein
MHIRVDTAADTMGETAPSSLRFDGRSIDVADVVDQWWGAGDRYFKVRDAAENVYVLRLDEPRNAWELLMFLSKRGAAVPNLLVKPVPPRPPHAGDGKI